VLAGALQFSAWKARQLACCRRLPGHCCAPRAYAAGATGVGAGAALRHGLQLGLRCSYCCAGLTATLLALGVMDLRAMAGVTAAITIERLSPDSEQAARCIGVVTIVAGVLLIAQAAAWP
jgi:predicted metal-binding membrane protein